MKKVIFFFFSIFFLSAFPAFAYDCQFHVTHSGTTADVTFVAPVDDNVRLNLEGMNGNCLSNSSGQAYNTLSCSSFSGSYGREDMSVITGNTYHTTINYSSLPAHVSPNVIQDHDPFSNICSSQDFTISDVAPTVNPISNATINAGDTYTASGSFSTTTDPDATSWTATVDYGDGGGTQSLTLSGTNFSLNHVYNTAGTYTETVSVTDNQGATGTGTAIITVSPTSSNACQFHITHSGTTADLTFVAPVTDNVRLNLEGMNANCISNSSSQAYNTLSCAQFSNTYGREDMSVITGNTYHTTIVFNSLPAQVSPNVIQDHDPFSNICSSQNLTQPVEKGSNRLISKEATLLA